tara:strand:+ start:349 stop:594 length:246 start_codon:yes stop_codon:yes gene_type:complete
MRRYKITPKKFSYGTSFHVEVWDEYDEYCGVYEDNVMSASSFIMRYWQSAEERKHRRELLADAIANCIEIDKKSGRKPSLD